MFKESYFLYLHKNESFYFLAFLFIEIPILVVLKMFFIKILKIRSTFNLKKLFFTEISVYFISICFLISYLFLS